MPSSPGSGCTSPRVSGGGRLLLTGTLGIVEVSAALLDQFLGSFDGVG